MIQEPSSPAILDLPDEMPFANQGLERLQQKRSQPLEMEDEGKYINQGLESLLKKRGQQTK